MYNLWDYFDIDDEITDSPSSILKEQANYFNQKSKKVMYIVIDETSIEEEQGTYSLKTDFNICAPRVSNYIFRLFTVYSNVLPIYPVHVEPNPLVFNEGPMNKSYECYDSQEFFETIRQVIQSKNTADVVRTLYIKSSR